MQLAEKIKDIFVVFTGHFIRNAAQVIVDANFTQNGSLPFNGPHAEGNTLMLLEYVLRCLYRVCLHDNENFFNKERFGTLMEPLVDQLENQLGEDDAVKRRQRSPHPIHN
jgi:U3 small nucleolar RNA-associated protein 10